MKPVWIFVFLCIWSKPVTADDRLWVSARINGKPAYLIFDTGASRTALFKKGADRLGRKSIWHPPKWMSVSNAVTLGTTEETLFELGNANLRTWFEVMEIPAYAQFSGDGLLAWKAFDVDLLQIDADNGIVKPVAKLPGDLASWQRFRLLDTAQVLTLEVPDDDSKPSYVYLDTGGGFGVNLNPAAWHQWRAAHTN